VCTAGYFVVVGGSFFRLIILQAVFSLYRFLFFFLSSNKIRGKVFAVLSKKINNYVIEEVTLLLSLALLSLPFSINLRWSSDLTPRYAREERDAPTQAPASKLRLQKALSLVAHDRLRRVSLICCGCTQLLHLRSTSFLFQKLQGSKVTFVFPMQFTPEPMSPVSVPRLCPATCFRSQLVGVTI